MFFSSINKNIFSKEEILFFYSFSFQNFIFFSQKMCLQKLIPKEWRRFYPGHHFRLSTFYMTESDLITTNLIMRSDHDDPQMVSSANLKLELF